MLGGEGLETHPSANTACGVRAPGADRAGHEARGAGRAAAGGSLGKLPPRVLCQALQRQPAELLRFPSVPPQRVSLLLGSKREED